MSNPRKAQLQAAIERHVSTARARPLPTDGTSWWLGKSRDEFHEHQRAEQGRMSASRFGQNYEPPKFQE